MNGQLMKEARKSCVGQVIIPEKQQQQSGNWTARTRDEEDFFQVILRQTNGSKNYKKIDFRKEVNSMGITKTAIGIFAGSVAVDAFKAAGQANDLKDNLILKGAGR